MAKGNVIFDQDLCKGCELCVKACPKGIVSIDEHRINKKGYNPATVVDMDQCTGCTSCATMCPDQVITVERF